MIVTTCWREDDLDGRTRIYTPRMYVAHGMYGAFIKLNVLCFFFYANKQLVSRARNTTTKTGSNTHAKTCF